MYCEYCDINDMLENEKIDRDIRDILLWMNDRIKTLEEELDSLKEKADESKDFESDVMNILYNIQNQLS